MLRPAQRTRHVRLIFPVVVGEVRYAREVHSSLGSVNEHALVPFGTNTLQYLIAQSKKKVPFAYFSYVHIWA